MNLLIKNGTVINADGRYNADVAVNNGKIISVEQGLKPGEQTQIVDASGLFVLPGAIDVHTHFELPFGDISSADDFFTGTRAAACGGVTTIIDFVSPERGENLIEALNKRKTIASAKTCIDYSLHMGLVEVNDRILSEMADVTAAGILSFKVFMTYASRITDNEFKRTLSRAKELNALVMVHAEDHEALEAKRAEFIAAGKTDAWHHYLSRPELVEAKAVKKAVELAKITGAALYIVHLACEEGLSEVKKAQREGYPIYAETCPQYLNFTCDVYKRPDGRNFVCSPPIKAKKSQDALWQSIINGAIRQGTVREGTGGRQARQGTVRQGTARQGTVLCLTRETQNRPLSRSPLSHRPLSRLSPSRPLSHRTPCLGVGINTVATDHCPFQSFEKDRGKDDFTKIPNGVMGVENLYPYMLGQANKGRITFERAIELCSSNPAKIFGLNPEKGSIKPNTDADIVLYDPDKNFTISQKNMHSAIDYTIWEGVRIKGYPVKTYSRGNLVYNCGEFLGETGQGKFIER